MLPGLQGSARGEPGWLVNVPTWLTTHDVWPDRDCERHRCSSQRLCANVVSIKLHNLECSGEAELTAARGLPGRIRAGLAECTLSTTARPTLSSRPSLR